MLNRIPGWPPALSDMLADLDNPTPKQIGKAFGVTERTAKGWIKNGAPRAVLLALYWITSHGQKNLNADLHNYAQLQIGMTKAYQRRIQELESQIQRLSKIANFGSANDPAEGVISGSCFDAPVTLTPDPGLQPTMPPASCEHRRLS